MHRDQAAYRELLEDIVSHAGSRPFEDVVRPWLATADEERAWLASFSERTGSPVPEASQEDLWRLYALSRISDLLTVSLGPRPRGDVERRWGPEFVASDLAAFMQGLGLSPIASRDFCPLFHEIVEVTQSSDSAEPISIDGPRLWDGWMLGPMVALRAGVRVRGGSDHVVKTIAETSTLYWTYARGHRPTQDLSVGWGSNSQWRTAFRRDYLLDGQAHYNVGAGPLGEDYMRKDGYTLDEIAELVRHRCFIRCPKPSDDLWPYGQMTTEPLL